MLSYISREKCFCKMCWSQEKKMGRKVWYIVLFYFFFIFFTGIFVRIHRMNHLLALEVRRCSNSESTPRLRSNNSHPSAYFRNSVNDYHIRFRDIQPRRRFYFRNSVIKNVALAQRSHAYIVIPIRIWCESDWFYPCTPYMDRIWTNGSITTVWVLYFIAYLFRSSAFPIFSRARLSYHAYVHGYLWQFVPLVWRSSRKAFTR